MPTATADTPVSILDWKFTAFMALLNISNVCALIAKTSHKTRWAILIGGGFFNVVDRQLKTTRLWVLADIYAGLKHDPVDAIMHNRLSDSNILK